MADETKIATKEELKALLADRDNDPELFNRDGTLAAWMNDPDHPARRHARWRAGEVERHQRALTRAQIDLETDWDLST